MTEDSPKVSELGESGILARILPLLPGVHDAGAGAIGPGDDAAVVRFPETRIVVSVDTQTQDQDFRLLWKNGHASTGFEVGWKSVAQNLSDLNAMGAEAVSLVFSLTLPGETPVSWVEDLAAGISAAISGLGANGCSVAGGDLGRGRELSVTATALGTLNGRAPVLRSGAQPGDVLAIAGRPGRAAAGWSLLESNHQAHGYDFQLRELQDAQTRPTPILGAGPAAARAGATSMMDVSDSLLVDGQRLAEASGVTLILDQEEALTGFADALLPAAHVLAREPQDPADLALTWVLTGGEDFTLLATFPPSTPLPEGFTAIGSVGTAGAEDSRKVLLNLPRSGRTTVEKAGWDHFDAS